MHFANTYVTNFTDLITSFLSNSQKKKKKKGDFLIRPQRGGKIIYLRYFIIV